MGYTSTQLIVLLAIDSPAHPLRRSLIKAQIGNTSLEAKVFALEQKLKRRDEELEADRQEIEKLMQDRRSLNRGYESAITASNQAMQELEAEKVSLPDGSTYRVMLIPDYRRGIAMLRNNRIKSESSWRIRRFPYEMN
jgi:hypothetical protein